MRRKVAGDWRAAGIVVAALVTLAACESVTPQRDIRATLLDEEGRPLPGAILYAEAVDESGAFAFTWAKAGEAGEVPQIAIRSLKISWRRGARLALAGFEPGRRPAVLYDPQRSVPSDGVVLTLEAPADSSALWNPDLMRLAYPFEGVPALAESARAERATPLKEAFERAWATRPPGS